MTPEDRCYKLLTDTNKPYNVQGVSDMLATQGVKKAQAERALSALAEQGKIACKEFGKTKIYFPLQHNLKEMSPEEKASKLDDIKDLNAKIKAVDESIVSIKRELATAMSCLTMEQLKEKFSSLQQQAENLDKKLAGHRTGTSVVISTSDIQNVESDLGKMLDHWARRRRIFRSIWDAVSENMDEKQSDIFEDIGIETDEACGEVLSVYQKLLPREKKFKSSVKQ